MSGKNIETVIMTFSASLAAILFGTMGIVGIVDTVFNFPMSENVIGSVISISFGLVFFGIACLFSLLAKVSWDY